MAKTPDSHPALLVDLRIEEPAWAEALPQIGALADKAAEAALRAVGLSPERCEISLLLCSDQEIAALNARFRGREKATNVLSWPSLALEQPLTSDVDIAQISGGAPEGTFGRIFLGDVALAYSTVRSEAETSFKSLEAHLSHLIVHGVLHLLGYDHELEDEAEAMAAREVAALSAIGVADPYGEDG